MAVSTAAALVYIGVGAETAAAIAPIVLSVVVSAVEYGLQTALTPTPSQSSSEASAQQVTFRQAIPPRRRYIGKNKAAGPFGFIQSSTEGALYEVILIATHQIEFLEHWIGDRQVTLNIDGEVVLPSNMINGTDATFILKYVPGFALQDPFFDLIDKFPSLWTSDHRLNGIAAVLLIQGAVAQQDFTKYYPGGPQAYRTVFNGARVYNSQDSGNDIDDETTWSFGHDNAADAIMDYLTHADGFRLPRSAVAIEDFAAAAAICDETVTWADSTTHARYPMCGGYNLNDAPKDTLSKMLAACDGYLFMRGDGKLSLKVGKWEAPTVTITDAHIRSFSLPKGLGPLRAANEIRASYVDPDQDFQPVEAAPWRDEADISLRGLKSRQIDMTFVPSHNQARRLMKAAAYRANPERAGTITTKFYGLNLIGERRFHLTIARRGIDLDCEVTSLKINFQTASVDIGVLAVDSAMYDFDPATEEQTQDIPDSIASDNIIPTPGTFAAAASGSTIGFSCDDPGRLDLQLNVEYSVQSSGVWTGVIVSPGAYSGRTPSLPAGTYDLRAWFSGALGGRGSTASDTGNVITASASDIDGPYTVATLPGSPVAGQTAFVTDALLPVYGSTVAGGGAEKVTVFYNGANWIVS